MGYGGCKPAYSTHEDTLRGMRMSLLHDPQYIDSSHLKDDEQKGKYPNTRAKDVIFPNEGIKEKSPDKNTHDGAWNKEFDAFTIEVPSIVKESKYVGKDQQRK